VSKPHSSYAAITSWDTPEGGVFEKKEKKREKEEEESGPAFKHLGSARQFFLTIL